MSESVFSNSVCLDVTFHKPGLRRKGNKSLIDTPANKDYLGLSKAILESEEYNAIINLANQFRRWCEKRTADSPLKRGTYLVPLTLLDAVYAELEAAEKAFNEAVDAFLAVYPERKAQAQIDLVDQYDEANYPDVEKLRKAFWVERRLLDFSPPDASKVGAAVKAKEMQRWAKDMQTAGDEIRATLRESARKLVHGLADRLESLNSTEAKHRLHPAAVENLSEFLDLFFHRDLTNDVEMQGLVAQCKNVLDGKDVKVLKDDAVARAEVLGEMNRVTEALDTLIESAPKRAFAFDEAA